MLAGVEWVEVGASYSNPKPKAGEKSDPFCPLLERFINLLALCPHCVIRGSCCAESWKWVVSHYYNSGLLVQDLQGWRSKLDTQVKIYKDVSRLLLRLALNCVFLSVVQISITKHGIACASDGAWVIHIGIQFSSTKRFHSCRNHHLSHSDWICQERKCSIFFLVWVTRLNLLSLYISLILMFHMTCAAFILGISGFRFLWIIECLNPHHLVWTQEPSELVIWSCHVFLYWFCMPLSSESWSWTSCHITNFILLSVHKL